MEMCSEALAVGVCVTRQTINASLSTLILVSFRAFYQTENAPEGLGEDQVPLLLLMNTSRQAAVLGRR